MIPKFMEFIDCPYLGDYFFDSCFAIIGKRIVKINKRRVWWIPTKLGSTSNTTDKMIIASAPPGAKDSASAENG